MAEPLTSIIDQIVPAPEGMSPTQLHILFDKKTRGYAEQYETALKISRNIPFNPQQIAVTDPLVLIIANVFSITDGQQAIRQAVQYYEKWALDCIKHGWMLALLSDNTFYNQPSEWEAPDAPPPGIPIIPEPKYNLSNPTEARLKQIVDYLSIDTDFQQTVMTTVNNAMVKLVNEVEEVDPVTTFHTEPTDTDLHGEVSPANNADGNKSNRRTKNKVESISVGTVADATE